MFVSCGNCDTEYELDDAKIPAGGARLRCKTCSHYFVIAPPEASDLRTADDLARDARSSAEAREADPEPERPAAPEEEFDPEAESDWEFNDVVESSAPEEAPEAPESAFDRDGGWGDLAAAEDVVDDLLGTTGAMDADPSAAVDELLGEIDFGDSRRGEPDGDRHAGSEDSSADLDFDEAEALEGSGGGAAVRGGDPLDDLADWDLFDQPAEAPDSALSARAKGLSGSAARERSGAEPRVEIAVAMAGHSPKRAGLIDRISVVAGWGAVFGLMIAALVGGFASHSREVRAPMGSWSGAGFEADQIAGRWVDNAVAGSVYVVSGRIRGAPDASRATRKALGIRLLDREGREIDRAPIPLAPAIPERILRESSPAELDAFQARRADRLAAVGEYWVPFEAVLTELPRFADRFELQPLER